MHEMIPEITAEQRQRSLGWFAVWWIETFTLVGRGGGVGMQIRFAPEVFQFIVNCYALDKHGRRRFNRVTLCRPKGWNKSGIAAAIALFEALAPCRFDHWAVEGETYTFLGETYYYEEGEPVGRPVQNPVIHILATTENQTGNTYESIFYNCTSKDAPLSVLMGVGLDAGMTRILLPEGGVIEPVSSGASGSDGGLETFAVADETHLYKVPRLKNLFQTVKRNLPKRSLDADPWLLETTTYFQAGDNSVAEGSFDYANDIREGRIKHAAGLYFDWRYSVLPFEDFSDEKKLKRAIVEAYGSAAKSPDGKDYVFLPDGRLEALNPATGRTADGWSLNDPNVEPAYSGDGWVLPDAIMAEIYQPDADPADSTRYYLNSRASVEDAWLTETEIMTHTVMKDLVDKAIEQRRLPMLWQDILSPDDEITLGFDGSVSNDSTALVGCRVKDGLLFIIKMDEAPDNNARAKWRVDRDSFDMQTRYMFDHYNVVGCFADAAFFESMIRDWERDYGQKMKVFARGKGGSELMRYYTNIRHRDVYKSLETIHTNTQYALTDADNDSGAIRFLADPRLLNHIRNARKHNRQFGYLIFKETPKSPKKIDAAMASILAYAARQQYLGNSQDDVEDTYYMPIRMY